MDIDDDSPTVEEGDPDERITREDTGNKEHAAELAG